MSDYDNTNSGVLFNNDKKEKTNQPALRGNMDIDGVSHWASAWAKVSSGTGKVYLSIAMQQKDVTDPETINAELHRIDNPKSDKAPSWEGVITVSEDEELPIVGWNRINPKTGSNMISIKVSQTQEGTQGNGDKIVDVDIFGDLLSKPEQTKQASAPAPEVDDVNWDDDIPF